MRHLFIRTLAGQKDPYFKNTTLLLHGDGTNGGQNNTFVDGSTNAFSITRNGNTTQGTFSPYGDNWSNFFDGTGDRLKFPDSADWDFGTGDFTIEFWFALNVIPTTSSTTRQSFVSHYKAATPSIGFNCQLAEAPDNKINFGWGDTALAVSAARTWSTNRWYHYAVARSGTSLKLFIDGEEVASVTNSTNITGSSNSCTIGALNVATSGENFIQHVNGYISNVRILKGTALYTAAFTPPTAPLTAITNTVLLTCQSNRFKDNSSSNRTATRDGDVRVQRFSPFSPTAAYAAGTIGGSGYFDGSGDNLSIASATGLCDFSAGEAFTFQVWLYRLGTGGMIFIQGGATTFQISVENSTGGWSYGKSGVVNIFYSQGAAPIGAWTHCTICRDTANRTRMWINGVSVASTTTDNYSFTTQATYIGSNNTSNSAFVNGYLSDMRILKGQALYDPTSSANIDVPTAPLTAVTNTSFLLNFTNAAILDNAMMAVPETVGNAQISTSVKKYGTGSLYFDGNGDYISLPKSNLLDFGAGDFTVEFWYYGVGSGDGILFLSGNSNSYAGFRMADGYLLLSSNGGGWITTSLNWTAPSAGLWTHYAATRSGSSIMVFLNGVLTKSFTTSESLYSAGTQYTIGRYQENASTYYYTNGYIDDLRITKGVARYTANFIPPTAPFPDF